MKGEIADEASVLASKKRPYVEENEREREERH